MTHDVDNILEKMLEGVIKNDPDVFMVDNMVVKLQYNPSNKNSSKEKYICPVHNDSWLGMVRKVGIKVKGEKAQKEICLPCFQNIEQFERDYPDLIQRREDKIKDNNNGDQTSEFLENDKEIVDYIYRVNSPVKKCSENPQVKKRINKFLMKNFPVIKEKNLIRNHSKYSYKGKYNDSNLKQYFANRFQAIIVAKVAHEYRNVLPRNLKKFYVGENPFQTVLTNGWKFSPKQTYQLYKTAEFLDDVGKIHFREGLVQL